MRGQLRTGLAALALATLPVALHAQTVSAPIAAALADTARGEQQADDARRQAGAVLAFSGVKPGDTVVDFLPGRYYWTKLFSDIVGPRGHVIAQSPAFADPAKVPPAAMAGWKNANVAYAGPGAGGQLPVDLFWTVQNYHDIANPRAGVGGGEAALLTFNKAVFAALKPGGTYVVIDHAATPGSGITATNTAHRIDAATVKAQVLAAGFRFVGESKVLANPADPRTANVFDPSIRGHTDQFAFKFRKPG